MAASVLLSATARRVVNDAGALRLERTGLVGLASFVYTPAMRRLVVPWLAVLIIGAGPWWLHAKEPASGHPDRGRDIFNGRGLCADCHGIEGYLAHRPPLPPEIAAIVDRLKPPAPDLRDFKTLRVKTDEERFHVVREGHSGTGMFPDRQLTDADIRDVLAYLKVLRNEPTAPPPGKSKSGR